MALRANMAGGFQSASTPENPDSIFSISAMGRSGAGEVSHRAPGWSPPHPLQCPTSLVAATPVQDLRFRAKVLLKDAKSRAPVVRLL
jgi:hypothetical protein